MTLTLFLHAFGPRYDLPAALSLYLFAAGGVVVISFVLVAVFAGERLGPEAVRYPRRRLRFMEPVAASRIPRAVCGALGVLGLLTIIVTGLFGNPNALYNPSEYLTWIYFWAAFVILSGLVGNLYALFNPFTAMFDLLSPPPARGGRVGWGAVGAFDLARLGVWPAAFVILCFACLELTSGMASRPWLVATLALVYTGVTLAGMAVFGRRQWLEHCEGFTVLFEIVARFGPTQVEGDPGADRLAPARGEGRVGGVRFYLRPWGVGLLDPAPAGLDRIVFLVLMLSTLAFDGLITTPAWQDLATATEGYWQPYGQFGFFVFRTLGLIALTATFTGAFLLFMRAVIYFGNRSDSPWQTRTAFAYTLVPIALVYNAAHNYYYLVVNAQNIVPALADPLGRGWHLYDVAGFHPSFALAGAAVVWYMQIVLIVLGHVVAVFLAHLRAGERFRTASAALLSQYPMLLLMVMYTMTSLWILAQPITREVR